LVFPVRAPAFQVLFFTPFTVGTIPPVPSSATPLAFIWFFCQIGPHLVVPLLRLAPFSPSVSPGLETPFFFRYPFGTGYPPSLLSSLRWDVFPPGDSGFYELVFFFVRLKFATLLTFSPPVCSGTGPSLGYFDGPPREATLNRWSNLEPSLAARFFFFVSMFGV